jgi:hypothetical protein
MFAILRGRWWRQSRPTRFLFSLLLSLSILSGPIAPALAQPSMAPRAAMPDEQVSPEFRGVLSQYGRFVQHDRFGEVWVPTVTPEGWHPYAPCHWVKTRKYGWYYDDKTPWGQIVHHYGRWFYDQQIGWAWDPGSAFSPGWVVWRTSPEWTGWAPMPPDHAFQNMSADQFNNSEQWIFVETAKRRLRREGCSAAAGPGAAAHDQVHHRAAIRRRHRCDRAARLHHRAVDRHQHRLLSVAGLVLRRNHLQLQLRLAEHVDLQCQRRLLAIRSTP